MLTSTNTYLYLSDPMLRSLFLPSVVTGLAIAALCSMLSVLVVLKRLAFIGQGVSHAAFGGVGLAAAMGLFAAAGAGGGATVGLLQFGVIFAFCLGAALLIGYLSEKGETEADTAIGIVLVASMGLGAVLIHRARTGVAWETFLFGSITAVGWFDAIVGIAVAAAVTLTLWALRRPLIFWAFDPGVARAVGVNERAMTLVLMTLLALATVTAMKLAGVVLATAMLVLPGAIALRLSKRAGVVLTLSGLASLIGVVGGIIVSFEADWPTGPAIVCVLSALFVVAWSARMIADRARLGMALALPLGVVASAAGIMLIWMGLLLLMRLVRVLLPS
jgi:ABC-type Mn2+/Zn2+ transport system permease subunit